MSKNVGLFNQYFVESDVLPFKDIWARNKVLLHTHKLDQLEKGVEDIKAFIKEKYANENVSAWKTAISPQAIPVFYLIEIPASIRTTFQKLKEDFSILSNRIVWCNELKSHLSELEEELEEHDAKYLSWFVSTLKDVFTYNYPETITVEQLKLIENGIDTIYEKVENCDKDSFAEYHFQLVESGAALLPTTQKAIDEFGE